MTLADLVSDPVVVAADAPCEAVDHGFRTEWTVSSVLVEPREPGGRYGMVARKDFLTTMTGRFGFGRSLWSRRPVSEIARWDAQRVRITDSLTEAADRLTSGDGYADMVVIGPDDTPVGVLDPTSLMAALATELAHQASHDPLTGVQSRAGFLADLEQLCATARASGGAVALAYLDLDRLKEVNDSLGHPSGDALIASVARRLATAAGPQDALGRLGGDEFALAHLLGPQNPDHDWRRRALDLGERLRSVVADLDPALPVRAHSRASVGIAVGAGALLGHEHLLHEADLAMYGAKKAGGDRVRLADADAPVPIARGTLPGSPVARLPEHLAQGLQLYYQPIVTVADGRTREVEALLRVRTAEGVDGPAGPLARALALDRALDLDLWVLDRACADLRAWDERWGPSAPTVMNVNLSPSALDADDLADRVLAVVDAHRLDPARVRLELSELASDAQLARALPQLTRIRAGGLRIGLDDLGGALSGLRSVTRLPVDVLKIDRSVIAGMLTDPVDRLLVALVGAVAQERGLTVVAEGVEDGAQYRALREAGVPMAQGFWMARPMPADQIGTHLGARPGARPAAQSAAHRGDMSPR
ncbi:putative bifunctional diguanylate cyclase/phosphodiesterase [Cellulomonas taurus]|uniref:putative bifunctional diguanylate cyclase/phosphodiesterase n=1 Tax=Cellulomonas taurus TaxID=2729175 RepID=UPI00145D7FDF|nr:bifunctional diguanylate cyclase/phosphodiesterase [Cellulomonas taurus]